MNTTKIICLTPVKNESWILEIFLTCTSQWADHIIIADQNSTDDSREIARKFEKVILVENLNDNYNEDTRQNLLLTESRKIKGKKLLISLDADEFFPTNLLDSGELDEMKKSSPGTAYGFKWINILPGFKKGWYSEGLHYWAFMDDGTPHRAKLIHSPRLPVYKNKHVLIRSKNQYILHFQYVNWDRMKSKQRFYQCIERIEFPSIHPVDLFRKYHHMDIVDKKKIISIPSNYYQSLQFKIDISKIDSTETYWWFDHEVLRYFQQYGIKNFRRLNIWQKEWVYRINSYNEENVLSKINDPRTMIDRLIFWVLRKTQAWGDCFTKNLIERVIKYKLWIN